MHAMRLRNGLGAFAKARPAREDPASFVVNPLTPPQKQTPVRDDRRLFYDRKRVTARSAKKHHFFASGSLNEAPAAFAI